MLRSLPAIALAFFAMLAVPAANRAEEVVRIGTYDHWPPFTVRDDQGRLTGFEVEMAHDLCRRIRAVCMIEAVPWLAVFDLLDRGAIDAYIGGMSVVPEREGRAWFSQPYVNTPAFFVTTRDSALTSLPFMRQLDLDDVDAEEQVTLAALAETLRHRRVGVHAGTTHESFLRDLMAGDVDLRKYDEAARSYVDMTAGRLDAVLDEGLTLLEMINAPDGSGEHLTLFGPALIGGPFGRGVAVAVRRGNETLRAKLDGAISAAKADGTLAQLALRWFGFNVVPP